MPNFYSRLNLASSIFPFYTEAAGRTIMIPQLDENWDRYNAANTTQDKGVPQVFYMHNVLPIAGGFQSVGFLLQLPGAPNATDFNTLYTLYDSNNTAFLFVPANGKNYIFDGSVGAWASFPFAPGTVINNDAVTVARVKGQSYIFYANLGCFKYTPGVSPSFDPVVLTGLTISTILGICAANGYMIAYSTTAVAWSSLTDPTNFVPSIQTGAGGGAVSDAKGKINFCLSIPGGFMIYCEDNVVGASFTANTSYPYIIVESVGSGGVDTTDKVAYQSTLPYHIALTNAGIQQITLNNSVPTFPEVSDFLTAQLFEDFDETTLKFTQTNLPAQLFVKFAAVSSRFIIISYGSQPEQFTHALCYDVALNRYGKFKINHACAFSYDDPEPSGLITYRALLRTNTENSGLLNTTYRQLFSQVVTTVQPKKNVAFLQVDGTVKLVDFQISEANANGVFILGKMKLQRSNMVVHQWSEVETLKKENVVSMFLLPTFDGKDFADAVPTVVTKNFALMRRFAKRYTADNISLCFVGAFNLTTIVFFFTIGGSR